MVSVIEWLDAHPLLWPLFIIAARVCDVTLGTMRTIFVVRGHRGIAATLGFLEVIIWMLGVSGVLQQVTVIKVLSYGAGFALGNACGIWVEQKLAIGQQILTLISPHRSSAVAHGLRLAGYMATEIPAKGGRGNVAMCVTVVSRRKTNEAVRIAQTIDDEVLVTVEDVRSTTLIRRPTNLHGGTSTPFTGWRSILKKK